jgi:hypothetical protein
VAGVRFGAHNGLKSDIAPSPKTFTSIAQVRQQLVSARNLGRQSRLKQYILELDIKTKSRRRT